MKYDNTRNNTGSKGSHTTKYLYFTSTYGVFEDDFATTDSDDDEYESDTIDNPHLSDCGLFGDEIDDKYPDRKNQVHGHINRTIRPALSGLTEVRR